jgi:hypothetical protein
MRRTITRALAVTAAALTWASVAAADQWNEKTILTFSDSVMVPGATLAPGTYVFRIADSPSARHVIRILSEDEQRLIATAQAVPMSRSEATGEIVVKFNPTDRSSPVAMKGWFYPNSKYGHEFIYPEDQAKHIAERTKTIVLAMEQPESAASTGAIHTVDANGTRTAWRGDAATAREWDVWRRGRDSASSERAKSTAPLVETGFRGERVALDRLENDASRFIGKRISVDGEVDEILGPRLFTIDEPHWGDLEGELMVFLPGNLVAAVRDDDRITVSGTVKRFVRADVEREWGWLGTDPAIEAKLSLKPVIVADRIVGGDSDRVVVLNASEKSDQAVGTSGSSATAGATAVIDDAGRIASAGDELVGRRLALPQARVVDTKDGGVVIASGDRKLFVLSEGKDAQRKVGETVTIQGVLLAMPDDMPGRLDIDDLNDEVYVYATQMQ